MPNAMLKPRDTKIGLPWWLRWWRTLPAIQETRFDLWVGKIPRRREWLPTSVFLSGKFHGLRSLVGYSTWGCKDLDTMEQLTHATHIPYQGKWNKAHVLDVLIEVKTLAGKYKQKWLKTPDKVSLADSWAPRICINYFNDLCSNLLLRNLPLKKFLLSPYFPPLPPSIHTHLLLDCFSSNLVTRYMEWTPPTLPQPASVPLIKMMLIIDTILSY